MRRKRMSGLSAAVVIVMLLSLVAGLFPAGAKAADAAGITVDGHKEAAWEQVKVLGRSGTPGWQGFQIDNLRLTHDSNFLYYYVDAVNVPNWGDNGQFIDIALNIGGADSGASGNPWGAQFHYGGMEAKPQFHIVQRVKNDAELNGAALYSASDPANPLLATWSPTTLQGAEFAVDRTQGFEGKIPLSVIGLKHGDVVKAHVVLSGNNSAEHGAFDVIPGSDGNAVSASWNESGANVDVQSNYAADFVIQTFSPGIDGSKESAWSGVPVLGVSPSAGWQDFHIDNLRITNDGTSLYYYIDALNVPNWGAEGQFIDIALSVNGQDSGKDANPWAAPFNYSGMEAKPQFHILQRVSEDTGLAAAAVYAAGDMAAPLAATWTDLKGAAFAVNRTQGFEGKVPLSLLGLKDGDVLRAHTVLSGNNSAEHGAFDVIPEDTGNQIAGSWNESGANADVQSLYTSPYTVRGAASDPTEPDPSALNTFNLRYYRYDGLQNQWDLWVWEDGKEGFEVDFTGTDEEGFATAQVKVQGRSINVIARPGSWSSQEAVRRVALPEGESAVDAWLVQEDTGVYYNRSDIDISPRIRTALMDSIDSITVMTTHEMQVGDVSGFTLKNVTRNRDVPVTAVQTGSHTLTLTVADPALVDVRDVYQVSHTRLTGTNVRMRNVLNDPAFYYDGRDLGLTYSQGASTFKVWAPTAVQVSVALYPDAGAYNEQGQVTDHTGGLETPMNRSANGVWTLRAEGDLAGKYYMYKVEFADGTVNYAVDPYATAVGANGARTAIVALPSTNPAGWSADVKPPTLNPTDAIVYELHVRDFSVDAASGITHKGKFKAFTENELTDPQGNSIGVDHLPELGVTHVHLLPSYDFKTINELTANNPDSSDPKFNWGYDPQNYNVPEGSYSTDPMNPAARITEFKEMVQALHQKGIRVIMDVVYNHTFSIEDGPFDKIVPGYYYRSNAAGVFTNGSGVGNEVATERPMVRKYIKDSVRYWAEEYNVDGFRFDLMGLIDTDTMTELTAELHGQSIPRS